MRPVRGLDKVLGDLGVQWDTVGGKRVGRGRVSVAATGPEASPTRPRDTLLPVARPEERFALGWARALFLACLAGLAFRYCAWCYDAGMAWIRHGR